MKCLKHFGGFLLLAIIFIAGATYLLWMPSPREPPYVLEKTWGEKGSAPGQFNEPTGVAVKGNEVFVSDGRNHRIQVFDLDGAALRQFGGDVLERPMNLDITNGELYVADFFADRIQVFSLDGEYRRSIGNPGPGPGEFSAPGGVAVAPGGDLYVAEFSNQRVQKLHADGGFDRQWGITGEVGTFGGKLRYPTDVALSRDGRQFVADGYNDRVLVIGPDGKLQYQWGGPFAMNIRGSFNGWFATVTGISVGPSGNVFVADFFNNRVQKFTPAGEFLTAFGIESTGPTHTAIAVAEADDGNVFVADFLNHRIQKWQPGK